MDIKKTLNKLPNSPGVYLMKDAFGEIIYIGKAANLKKRVLSYFQKGRISYKTDALMSNVTDVDCITTSSEEEALLLEAALVKEKQPKFNVMLKDDKRYPLLKLTLDEKFPRLVIARREKKDGAMYFGPYTSATLLRKALGIMRRIFPLRVCRTTPKTACLNYHIGECVAPCIYKINKEEYSQIVNDVILFLKGKKKELLDILSKRMKDAAVNKNFELAARLRDQIEALSIVLKKGSGTFLSTPVRIEAFDISDISGKEAVGSMVSFFSGEPDKSNYRRFRIKTVFKVNDYKMIEEVVRRRYQRVLEENRPLPDLIVIDGGRGHVNAAKKALDELNLKSIAVLGIAKKEEKIFLSGEKSSLKLSRDSTVLQLIQRVRDEAHRFAQDYHHILRRKKIIGK